MLEIALANINSFASAPYSTQAVDILNQILQRQQALEQKVSDLETEVRNLKDELSISKADNCKLRAEVHELQTKVAILEDMGGRGVERGGEEVTSEILDALEISGTIHSLQVQLDELAETTAKERAYDRKRITALEDPPAPAPTAKTIAHIDSLHDAMRRHRLKQVSFKEAGKLLGLTRQRVHTMKRLIAEDERFLIVKDPHHKQRLLIQLRGAR